MNSRIWVDPAVCRGKPVIRNTRVLVSNILADLAAGQAHEQVIESYPNVTEDDIKAALEFGSELANFESLPLEAGAQ